MEEGDQSVPSTPKKTPVKDEKIVSKSAKRKSEKSESMNSSVDNNKKTKVEIVLSPKRASDKKRPWYTPDAEILTAIHLDVRNKRAWQVVLSEKVRDLRSFIDVIEREFMCPVCQSFVEKPVTTPCHHNFCKSCIVRSLELYGPKCTICRESLLVIPEIEEGLERPGKPIVDVSMNRELVAALKTIIPTYSVD